MQKLAPAWIFQTGDYENGLQATPIVIDGVIYLSTSNSWVFALDGATGRILWEYRFAWQIVPLYGKQNRGVAVGHGRVFLGTADNHMVALDQKTGAEVWRVNVEDSRQCGCNITGAPLVVKDMVIAGVTGGDSAHRGYLTAFDASTGRMRWRFYTIPGPGEKGHETWPGESWQVRRRRHLDDRLLRSRTEPSLLGRRQCRRRSQRLQCAVATISTPAASIALDPDTGKLKWHYQEIPQDVWDYDAAFEMYLVDLPVDGRIRQGVMQATKTGYVGARSHQRRVPQGVAVRRRISTGSFRSHRRRKLVGEWSRSRESRSWCAPARSAPKAGTRRLIRRARAGSTFRCRRSATI